MLSKSLEMLLASVMPAMMKRAMRASGKTGSVTLRVAGLAT